MDRILIKLRKNQDNHTWTVQIGKSSMFFVFAWPAMNTYERLLSLHVLTIVFVPHNFILQKM